MLKNIPKIVSPQLLKVLCEMGHGDEIVLADGNFPAESMGKGAIVVRADATAWRSFWTQFWRWCRWTSMRSSRRH